METNYCHNCAAIFGYLNDIKCTDVLESKYQWKKYLKHTIPSSGFDLNSIFSDPTTAKYADWIINAEHAGSYEIDYKQRGNIIWVIGSTIGVQLINSEYVLPLDAIKVVLSTDPQLIHAFPISSTTLSTAKCERCSNTIIT